MLDTFGWICVCSFLSRVQLLGLRTEWTVQGLSLFVFLGEKLGVELASMKIRCCIILNEHGPPGPSIFGRKLPPSPNSKWQGIC